MNRFFLILALFISQTFINSVFAQTASFTTQDNLLTLPSVQVSDNTRFENVVVRITSFGAIATDDPVVGNDIEFNLATNALYLPQVTVDGVLYSRISLTGLTFVIVSLDGINVDNGDAGNYALDIIVTALGNTLPLIRVDNVPKPETQNEFCSDEIYNQFQRSVQGFTGTWQITNCSFNGTNGLIDAILTITSPMSMTVPYSVQYNYVAQ